jgi:pimeloyl-ACP methyl ester carboxylesterase
MTDRLHFFSGNERCAAWLTLPSGTGPHPVVILVHGGGAIHEMKLPDYERAFSVAGFAVLAFDYRHFGASEGEPRQLMSVRRHLEDVDAALAFARSRTDLDPDRIALWGTSLGASHVVAAAAKHGGLAAAVVQCPVLRGRAPALASGLANVLRLTGPIVSDLVRGALGLPRRYVPIVGRPGERAFVTVPGAYEGWQSVVPDGGAFDNRVAAGAALPILFYDAAAKARRIRCPLLVCVSDAETLMDPAIAVKVAKDAPQGIAVHYPADHFSVYHAPLFERLVADQLDFLRKHLV